jgi:hypothetical protein
VGKHSGIRIQRFAALRIVQKWHLFQLQGQQSSCFVAFSRLMPSLDQGVPPERVLELPGEGGDLAAVAKAAGGAVKKALRWLPAGVVRCGF